MAAASEFVQWAEWVDGEGRVHAIPREDWEILRRIHRATDDDPTIVPQGGKVTMRWLPKGTLPRAWMEVIWESAHDAK